MALDRNAVIEETIEEINKSGIKRENLGWDKINVTRRTQKSSELESSNASGVTFSQRIIYGNNLHDLAYNNKKIKGLKGFIKRRIFKMIYPVYKNYFDLQEQFENQKAIIINKLLLSEETEEDNKK